MADRYYPDFNEPEWINVPVVDYQRMKENLDYYESTIYMINEILDPESELTDTEKQIIEYLDTLKKNLN